MITKRKNKSRSTISISLTHSLIKGTGVVWISFADKCGGFLPNSNCNCLVSTWVDNNRRRPRKGWFTKTLKQLGNGGIVSKIRNKNCLMRMPTRKDNPTIVMFPDKTLTEQKNEINPLIKMANRIFWHIIMLDWRQHTYHIWVLVSWKCPPVWRS